MTSHCKQLKSRSSRFCSLGRQQCPHPVYGYNASPCSSHMPWPSRGCCSKVPIESVMQIILCCIGIVLEAFFDPVKGKLLNLRVMTVFNADGTLHSVSKLHHITMYSVFALSGIVDLIVLLIPLIPRNVSTFFFTMAFFIEGLLFWFHSHGSEVLEMTVHSLLFLTISASVILSLIRIQKPTNCFVGALLGVSIMVQGSWFIHAGAILYGGSSAWQNRHSEANETKQLMLAVVLFSWHVIGTMIFAGLLFILILAILRCYIRRTSDKFGQTTENNHYISNGLQVEIDNKNDDDDSLESNDPAIVEETKLIQS